MLTDALDGTLSPEEQVRFDRHMAGCGTCQGMLADAQRGAAWLDLLRSSPPEPPAGLLDRILAKTSGLAAAQAGGQADSSQASGPLYAEVSRVPSRLATMATRIVPPGVSPSNTSMPGRSATVLPFPQRMAAALRLKPIGRAMLQPRLAMTAAMAFFSIGLTLNLTGVRLDEFHASDLKPANVRRGFYQANAHVVRYVDNLRAVYELESRVRDLQRSSDNNAAPTQNPADKAPASDPKAGPDHKSDGKQARPRTGSGTSRRQGPMEPAIPHSLWASYSATPSGLLIVSVGTRSNLQEGETV